MPVFILQQRLVPAAAKYLPFLHTSARFMSSKETGPSPLLTFQDVLSDENKKRSTKKLMSIKPARSLDEHKLKPGFGYAAILVPLCTVQGEPSLLFTLRSTRLKNHRGQVSIWCTFDPIHSFPGGNVEETDLSMEHTALRETEEELGMEPESFDMWGQMQVLPGSHSGKLVYPFLANAGEIDLSTLKINHDEVEEVFTVPLHCLCNHVASTYYRYAPSYTLPVYTGGAHRIWGLTAIVVHQALSAIAPGLYNFKLKHRQSRYRQGHDNKRHHSHRS